MELDKAMERNNWGKTKKQKSHKPRLTIKTISTETAECHHTR
jgi:hypothetical protein